MTAYHHTGKQILQGRDHVADCASEEIAAFIVDALNNHDHPLDAFDPDQGALPYDDGVRHDVRRQSDEYACSCGARWDVADGADHP